MNQYINCCFDLFFHPAWFSYCTTNTFTSAWFWYSTENTFCARLLEMNKKNKILYKNTFFILRFYHWITTKGKQLKKAIVFWTSKSAPSGLKTGFNTSLNRYKSRKQFIQWNGSIDNKINLLKKNCLNWGFP